MLCGPFVLHTPTSKESRLTLRGIMIIITPLLVEVWDNLLCPSPSVVLLLGLLGWSS